VRATKPLALPGTIIRGLEVRFEAGRAVQIEAEAGADAMRSLCARDDGAARLGEVALVDGQGRIGPLDTIFYDTLLDENAASHVALGRAYEFTVDDEADRRRANLSAIHVDFMIGSPEPHRRRRPRPGPPRRSLGATLIPPHPRRGAGAVERARLEIA
jgi:aminopeptidase